MLNEFPTLTVPRLPLVAGFLCLCILPTVGVSALPQIADLTSQGRTVQVDNYYALAKEHIYDSLLLSFELAEKGVKLADRINYKEGKADCLSMLALANELNGEMAIGIKMYQEAYDLYQEVGQVELAVGCIINMGISNYLSGDYGKALRFYSQALEEARQADLASTESKILNNIGAIQRHLEDYQEAVHTYNRSLEIKEEIGDSMGFAMTLENLGLAYSYLDQPEKSIEYIQMAIDRFDQSNRDREASQAKLSLATAYNSMGRSETAEDILTQIISRDFINYTPVLRSQTYLELAKIYQVNKDIVAWEKALDPGYQIILNTENEDVKSSYLRQYIDLYRETQRYEEAFDTQEEYIKSLQVLNQWDKIKLEKEMQAKFNLSDKESQLENQRIILKQQASERNWSLAVAGISLILLLGAVRYGQTKIKSNKMLQSQKKVIEANLREKELLLREIHHRVKNNLQVVSSLLSLQARSLKGKEAASALHDGKNRVRSMALIHQNLYQEEHLSGVDSQSYIDRLCKSLIKTYQTHHSDVRLLTEVDPILLEIDSVIPMGLILNELICNALKYAFTADQVAEILVKLQHEDDVLHLIVKDNGVGMDTENHRDLDSLGFKLIKSLTAKLKGTFEITSSGGTEVHCQFRNFKLVQAS